MAAALALVSMRVLGRGAVAMVAAAAPGLAMVQQLVAPLAPQETAVAVAGGPPTAILFSVQDEERCFVVDNAGASRIMFRVVTAAGCWERLSITPAEGVLSGGESLTFSASRIAATAVGVTDVVMVEYLVLAGLGLPDASAVSFCAEIFNNPAYHTHKALLTVNVNHVP